MNRKMTSKPLVDGAGHVDPKVLEGLRERARPTRDDDTAFLDSPTHSRDGLAEQLGEGVIESITSGQDDELEMRDVVVAEEIGGPFVETTSDVEMADDDDAPNIPGATRSPFPVT